MFGYIYITENLINHKKYIGKKTSKKFLGTKYLGSGRLLVQAVKKYGEENFVVTMLDTADSLDELNEKEVYYIAKYNAQESNQFYNISRGGLDGGPLFKGHKHTEETKRKIGNSVRGEKNGYFGKKHSDEERARMSEKRKQRVTTEETRKKMSIARKGMKFTEEHKRKISESQKGEKSKNYGKPLPDITKQKISKTVSNQVWMNNGTTDKRVPKEMVLTYVEQGYTFGRHKYKKGSTTIEKVLQEKDL
jgi:group I intron endonuclease